MANPYDLVANGISDMARFTQLLSTRKIIRDPLSGPLDGSNVFFNVNFAPCLTSGSTAVYIGTTPQVGYTFIAEAGQFQLASPPASQVYANYTYSSLGGDQLTKMLFLGFDEMESRWGRGLRLSSSLVSYTAADESSAAMYIVSPTDLSDPYAQGIFFSSSRKQIAFFMKCIQYGYYSQRLFEEAQSGMSYREAGGMAVDTTRRAPNLALALARVEKDLNGMLIVAQSDWEAGGYAIHSSQSYDYQSAFQWQGNTANGQNASTNTRNGAL